MYPLFQSAGSVRMSMRYGKVVVDASDSTPVAVVNAASDAAVKLWAATQVSLDNVSCEDESEGDSIEAVR